MLIFFLSFEYFVPLHLFIFLLYLYENISFYYFIVFILQSGKYEPLMVFQIVNKLFVLKISSALCHYVIIIVLRRRRRSFTYILTSNMLIKVVCSLFSSCCISKCNIFNELKPLSLTAFESHKVPVWLHKIFSQ